jgi:hypothetical protein
VVEFKKPVFFVFDMALNSILIECFFFSDDGEVLE